MLKLNWINVKSALVYGLLWGLLAVFIEIKEIGDVFKLNWQDLLNVFVMAGLAIVITLVKNILTTDSGNFVGAIKVIPDNK